MPSSTRTARRVPARPTIRIIEGLAAAGWSLQWIGEQIGVTGEAVRQMIYRSEVTEATEATVHYLAEQVGDSIGPSLRSMQWARRRGFLRLVWGSDEEIADLRKISGHSFDDQTFIERAHQEKYAGPPTLNLDLDVWWSRFEILRSFSERTGTARVPSGHIEDGFHLYQWLWRTRAYRELLSDEQRFALEGLPGFTYSYVDTPSTEIDTERRTWSTEEAFSAA